MSGLAEIMGNMEAEMIGKIVYNFSQLGSSMSGIFAPGDNGNTTIVTIQNNLKAIVTGSFGGNIQSIALAVATLFFFIATIELGMQERLTLDIFMKHFIKIGVSWFLILNAGTFYNGMLDFGEGVTNIVSSQFYLKDTNGNKVTDWNTKKKNKTGKSDNDNRDNDNPTVTSCMSKMQSSEESTRDEGIAEYGEILAEQITEEGHGAFGVFDFLGRMISVGIIELVLQIASLALLVICYIIAFSRIIELNVRGCFLPIAFALMSDDGWKGAGGRYIRKFVAVASQGAVLCAISNVTGSIISFALGNMMGGKNEIMDLLIILGVCIAVVSLMFKSIGIINDVFGA